MPEVQSRNVHATSPGLARKNLVVPKPIKEVPLLPVRAQILGVGSKARVSRLPCSQSVSPHPPGGFDPATLYAHPRGDKDQEIRVRTGKFGF
jgi:hypothetical protein